MGRCRTCTGSTSPFDGTRTFPSRISLQYRPYRRAYCLPTRQRVIMKERSFYGFLKIFPHKYKKDLSPFWDGLFCLFYVSVYSRCTPKQKNSSYYSTRLGHRIACYAHPRRAEMVFLSTSCSNSRSRQTTYPPTNLLLFSSLLFFFVGGTLLLEW